MSLRRNLAKAVLEHERIITTPAKAKEVRPFVEKLITLARRAAPLKDTDERKDRARYLHYYRLALQRLQDKKAVQKLFGEGEWRQEGSLGERFADRPGGYTRIVRLSGSRLGVPVGNTVGQIPELVYTIAGRERSLKLTGNRLGDNAEQVIFELVGAEEAAGEEEVTPIVSANSDVEQSEADASEHETEEDEVPAAGESSADKPEDTEPPE